MPLIKSLVFFGGLKTIAARRPVYRLGKENSNGKLANSSFRPRPILQRWPESTARNNQLQRLFIYLQVAGQSRVTFGLVRLRQDSGKPVFRFPDFFLKFARIRRRCQLSQVCQFKPDSAPKVPRFGGFLGEVE